MSKFNDATNQVGWVVGIGMLAVGIAIILGVLMGLGGVDVTPAGWEAGWLSVLSEDTMGKYGLGLLIMIGVAIAWMPVGLILEKLGVDNNPMGWGIEIMFLYGGVGVLGALLYSVGAISTRIAVQF